MTFKTTKTVILAGALSLSFAATAADWDNIPLPVSPGNNMEWELQENYSDSFNYTGKPNSFTSKWNDTYFNGWTGPGLTYWQQSESWVADGNLIIGASRRAGTNQVNAGVVTSKTKVKYPIFLEARIKVSNLELSSNFWLLSENDEREIDVLEVYGGANDDWFARNMSTNFHVFMRNADNSIRSDFNDQTHNTPPWGTYWRDGFHRFAVYWKSPTEVTFYINGQETPNGSWAEVVMKDKDYTGAILDKNTYNMDEESFIIIDTEDHSWRSEAGIVASDADLANNSKNKMYVDWIRVYKPVSTSGGDNGTPDTGDITAPTSNTNVQLVHSNLCLDVAGGAMWNGSNYQQWVCNTGNQNQRFKFNSLGNGEYAISSQKSQLCMELASGSSADGAVIQQWVCNYADQKQRWTLFDKGSNTFEIRNKQSGKCMEVRNNSGANGGVIQQSSCDGGNNQRFRFI
ncbi:RICIN domain-containing protein [Echinimonas agarilytica]|uniref:RICIN domain-containing protein n=1 Tax=Echinimonas agarilytica TaxID=1215918 RepID=A0AA42B8W6_9GAMM|nr:RICIN domain-containing protein [Echinimonas agarilytica]MCM2681307.1 RICIN domain-containing protein [Echinimonas agarilytica]